MGTGAGAGGNAVGGLRSTHKAKLSAAQQKGSVVGVCVGGPRLKRKKNVRDMKDNGHKCEVSAFSGDAVI